MRKENGPRDGSNVKVRAWHSQTYGWIIDVRHGTHGDLISFRAKYAHKIADAIVDTIEALEAKNGNIK